MPATETATPHYTWRWDDEARRRMDDVLEDERLDLEGRATYIAREVVRRVVDYHLDLGTLSGSHEVLTRWENAADQSLFEDFYPRLSDMEKSRVLVKLRNLHDRGSF